MSEQSPDYIGPDGEIVDATARGAMPATLEWIKINVEAAILPAIEEPVFLYDAKADSMWIGCRAEVLDEDGWVWCNCYSDVGYWRGKWETSTADFDDDYKPTHFCRLPIPPK